MDECCSKEECCPSEQESCHEEDQFDWFLALADEAWSEVVKEKIKEHILETQGKRLNELAKIISETNSQRWKLKMEKENCCYEFKEKIASFFSNMKK